MKSKFFSIVICLLLTANLSRGQNGYTFSSSVSTYSDLISPIIIANNAAINGSYYNIPFLTFNYWGVVYTSFTFNTSAYFYPGTTASYGFYPLYANLKGLGNTQIGYIIDSIGGAGNRILKIEWKDAGFANDLTNADKISFQIWFYEADNSIEMHYGNWLIDSSHFSTLFSNPTGIQVAFSQPSLISFYNLGGDPSAPSFIMNPSTFTYLNGYPTTGTTYTFTPILTSVNDLSASVSDKYSIFPDCKNGHLIINCNGKLINGGTDFKIIDLSGQIVLTGKLGIDNYQLIDMNLIRRGIYFLEYTIDNKVKREKFIY